MEPHVDLADCVGLFCVRQAPDDPPSLAASSMTVYNELLRRHPEWLPRLYEGYPWTRMEEEAPGESPVSDYRVPVFSAAAGTVTCRFPACNSGRVKDHVAGCVGQPRIRGGRHAQNGAESAAIETVGLDYQDRTPKARFAVGGFPYHSDLSA